MIRSFSSPRPSRLTSSVTLLAGGCLCLLLAGGCKRSGTQKTSEKPFGFTTESIDTHLTICVDLSGSFEREFSRSGKAYPFLLKAIDYYVRNRKGTNRLLIVQLSGATSPILYEGSPRSFMDAYPTPDAFRRFLLSKADPRGSRVHDSIADGMDYALRSPGVVPGKTKMVLLCLTDMDENVGGEPSRHRLVKAFQQWASQGNLLGLYFVHPLLEPYWGATLRHCGFGDRARITTGFNAETPLPSF